MTACLLIDRITITGCIDKVVVIVNNVKDNSQIANLINDINKVTFAMLLAELQQHLSESIKSTTDRIVQVKALTDYCISSEVHYV